MLGGRPRGRIPEIGEKFGWWEVVGGAFKDGKVLRIPCRCRCGYTASIARTNLMREHGTLSCKRCYGLSRRSRDLVPGWFWSHIVVNARKRGIEISISREYAETLLRQQSQRCAYTGCRIEFAKLSTRMRSQSTASLDRRDSTLGYVEGNVQWVHKSVNMMKGSMTETLFLILVQQIWDHRVRPKRKAS